MPKLEDSLFCKPIGSAKKEDLFYSTFLTTSNSTLSFRSLDLDIDLYMIYDWVNKSYSRKFWQLNGSRQLVKNTYETILKNPNAHSFIGLINNKPICQIDIYRLSADELSQHVQASLNDCGIHLLMLPPKQLQKNWSFFALKAFQDFYFSFSESNYLYCEPDVENDMANQLALKAGFEFIKAVTLSYKVANLYCISRSQFTLPEDFQK